MAIAIFDRAREQGSGTRVALREPKRVDQAVADNTAMVLGDCVKTPATAVPCLAKAGSVADLEQRCLVALDDEGSEGQVMRR